MNLPPNISESEFVSIVEKISSTLCKKFRFGYLVEEDIKQECYILAIAALEKYNGKHPLENYLRVCIKKRLCTFKRDNYQRLYEKKCSCKFCKDKSESHDYKMNCSRYKNWYENNQRKKNIISPIGLQQVNNTNADKLVREDNVEKLVDDGEIFEIIDRKLPVQMRSDYLKMKSGSKISKSREDEILCKIREILNGYGIET